MALSETLINPSSGRDVVPLQTSVNLESETHILENLSQYCGPTTHSNWVIPGKLLVGAFPQKNELSPLLSAGVQTFVCTVELDAARGRPPYFEEARALAKAGSSTDSTMVPPGKLTFVQFEMENGQAAEDARVLILATNVMNAMKRDEVVYLHCNDGCGRTGTLASIVLHMLYGIPAERAMALCQLMHDQRHHAAAQKSSLSPQTAMQRIQVSRIIKSLQITTAAATAATDADADAAPVNN